MIQMIIIFESESLSPGSDSLYQSTCPLPEKGHPKGCPFSGGQPSAGKDPLRSIWQEGKPIPSCTTPLKSIPGLDLDCPGAPKRRESEQDSLLFGGQPAAGNYPLRSNWRGSHSLPSRAHPMQSRQLVRIRIAPDYRKDQFTVIANQ